MCAERLRRVNADPLLIVERIVWPQRGLAPYARQPGPLLPRFAGKLVLAARIGFRCRSAPKGTWSTARIAFRRRVGDVLRGWICIFAFGEVWRSFVPIEDHWDFDLRSIPKR